MVTALEAQEQEVGIFSDEDALRLLADWSGQPVDELPGEAYAIVRECGNLPLALAMIGAMVQGNQRRWDNALAKLRVADLEGIGRRFPNYPYPNLLRAIQVSVDDLHPNFRRRYLDLAVFPEDAPIPEVTIETLWNSRGVSKSETEDLLDLFVDRSLARKDDQGLSLHDLQVDFVRKQAGDMRKLHGRLLKSYGERCTDGWKTGPDDGYFFKHLALHLAGAGRGKELRDLLLDFDWLQAKLSDGPPSELLSDFELAGENKSLRLVQGAIRLGAHVLAQDRNQLATELTGRLLGTKIAVSERCCDAYVRRPLVHGFDR